MLLLPYDSETNELPLWKEPSESPDQPHFVQLAATLVDPVSRQITEQMNVIIKPDGWTIPEELSALHGITFERAMDEGIAEVDALNQFLDMWERCSLRIGFNVSFDDRMIRIALKRYKDDELAERFKASPKSCMMWESKPFTKLPKNKNPKLSEAYSHFFGEELQGAHDAMVDTLACTRIYWAIQDLQAEAA
jgi:DNA polymerase III subunit epsilon